MANHQDVGDALLLLAGQFHSEGSVMSAISCLEAIAQAPDPLFPLTESKARRQLAALLLAHSNNVLEAKAHLEKTQLLLGNIHGNWDLKLGVISDLGRCHKLLGNVRLQHQMYQTGLDECRTAAALRDSPSSDLWEVHFLLRLADSLVTSGDSAQALSMIEAGVSQVADRQQDGRIQILCLLFLLQLQMVESAPSETSERIMLQASSMFSSLPAERHNERLTLQLKLHFHILRALFLLRLGHNSELSTPQAGEGRASWMPAVVCAIEDLVAQLQLSTPENVAWEYEWMPPAAVLALVHLLCAQILLPCSKLKHVLGHLQKCQSVVEADLRRLGVNYLPAPQGSSRELELGHHTIWDSRLLLVFRFLALEAQAQVFITMADLGPAQECVQGAVELVQSFPMLLQQLRPSNHLLVGLYCHSMGCYKEAIACFEASRSEASSPQWANLAASQIALSWLSSGTPYAVQNAMAALGPLADTARALGDTPEADVDQGFSLQEKALSLLSVGLAAQLHGSVVEAKALLMKALRVAHGPLSNQQLVCQILNALGPISMEEGDMEGSQRMLSNSFQVGKSIFDTPAMVKALGSMQPLLMASGQIQQAQQNHEYAVRKAAEVNQAAAVASTTPGHHSILNYAASLFQA